MLFRENLAACDIDTIVGPATLDIWILEIAVDMPAEGRRTGVIADLLYLFSSGSTNGCVNSSRRSAGAGRQLLRHVTVGH